MSQINVVEIFLLIQGRQGFLKQGEKLIAYTLSKFKTYFLKDTIKGMKRQAIDEHKIFVKHLPDIGLNPKYVFLKSQFNNMKTNPVKISEKLNSHFIKKQI